MDRMYKSCLSVLKCSIIIFVVSLALVVQVGLCSNTLKISDVTDTVLLDNSGALLGVGDWDANMKIDCFILKPSGQLDVLLANNPKPFQKSETFATKRLLEAENITKSLVGIVPTDFDGDTRMDILKVVKKDNKYEMTIFWGSSDGGIDPSPTPMPVTFLDEPFLLDFDGDMRPDILGEDEAGHVVLLSLTPGRNATSSQPPEFSGLKLWSPHGHAFTDVDGDLAPDIVLTVKEGDTMKFKVLLNQRGSYSGHLEIDLPEGGFKKIGQPSFLDFDADGKMDIAVALCEEDDCWSTKLWVWSHKKWYVVLDSLSSPDTPRRLATSHDEAFPQTYMMLRSSDVTLDGYPDLLVTLETKVEKKEKPSISAYVLLNVAHTGGCNFSRCLEPQWSHGIGENVLYSAFFDLGGNGVSDYVTVSRGEGAQLATHFYTNQLDGDAYFLKVRVVSGLCYDSCPHNGKPYGVNQIGPTVRINTTRTDGSEQVAIGTQLSQTAHLSLQPADVTFGLDQMPNFVDKMAVGIPNPRDTDLRWREWTFIIPNSVVIVIPHPPGQPDKWHDKLFVEPSRNVLIAAAIVAGTIGFVAALVGLLHWREKREDAREKQQSAHRFHFDAM